MNVRIQSMIVNHHEFEGVAFVSFEGIFYKGCTRCGGTGHFMFNGEDDLCYRCGNTSEKLGDELGSREDAEKWAHKVALSRAAADRKRNREFQAKQDKMAAKQEALKAVDPELYEFMMGINIQEHFHQYETEWEFEEAKRAGLIPAPERSAFLVSLAENLRYAAQCDKPFTEKMVAAARKVMESRKAEEATKAAHPAPAGRVIVTGEILSTKVVDSDFGTTYKMNLKADEGYRVWVSIPKKQVEELHTEWLAALEAEGKSWGDEGPESFLAGAKGRRITFTATLEPSRDDVSFAFGSRPTKGAWL